MGQRELTSTEIWEVDDDYYDNVVMIETMKSAKHRRRYTRGRRNTYREACRKFSHSTSRSLCAWRRRKAHTFTTRTGNRFIGFLQAGGPTILGSNYPAGEGESYRAASIHADLSPGCSLEWES
ncbi:MAG: hypothetical protein V8R14_06140 [Clostridia bacterium]